jgi:metallo-beta-lactamase family protein
MPRLHFLGAAGTVTGSRFLLETRGKKILIDCGLFQGLKELRLKNWDDFPFPAVDIDAIFLTHAHIDHSGYIPRLCRYGFSGTVYGTPATKDLCHILLPDTAHIQEEDAHWANKKGFSRHDPALPLYTVEDATTALKQIKSLFYGEDFFLTDNLRIKFKDAGHILGSAFVDVKINNNGKSRRILFSGDLGRPDQPILRNPVQAFNVDYLVLESTYGNRLHQDSSPGEDLTRIINESVDRGGVLVIPSFAVGRTQSLLYTIRELEEAKKIPLLPVFVDSPMAINATKIFELHKGDYDYAAKILEIRGKRILHPRRLKVCRKREASMAINDVKNQAIIISASGMVTGGRILHHLAQRLPDTKNTVLFIGYQALGTRGRAILEGNHSIKIHGQQVPVEAKIENISGFSAHADYNEILAWLMGFNRPPEKTFLVHGEPEASQALAKHIKNQLGWQVHIPELEETIELQ